MPNIIEPEERLLLQVKQIILSDLEPSVLTTQLRFLFSFFFATVLSSLVIGELSLKLTPIAFVFSEFSEKNLGVVAHLFAGAFLVILTNVIFRGICSSRLQYRLLIQRNLSSMVAWTVLIAMIFASIKTDVIFKNAFKNIIFWLMGGIIAAVAIWGRAHFNRNYLEKSCESLKKPT